MDFLLKIKNLVPGMGGDSRALPSERRDTPRLVLPIEGTCTTEDSRAFSATISDVGLYGMRVEVPRAQSVGSVLSVKVIRGQGIIALSNFEVDTIRTEVLWCRKAPGKKGHVIGVKYADTRQKLNSSWLRFIFQKFGINTGSTTQRRRDIRIRSKVPVKVVDGTTAISAEAVNMGVGGVLLACKQVFPEQSSLVLHIGPYARLPELTLRGTVVRRRLSKKAEAWLLGVAFHGATYDDSKLLSKYLLRILDDAEKAEASSITL